MSALWPWRASTRLIVAKASFAIFEGGDPSDSSAATLLAHCGRATKSLPSELADGRRRPSRVLRIFRRTIPQLAH